jgi:hypothetical protein
MIKIYLKTSSLRLFKGKSVNISNIYTNKQFFFLYILFFFFYIEYIYFKQSKLEIFRVINESKKYPLQILLSLFENLILGNFRTKWKKFNKFHVQKKKLLSARTHLQFFDHNLHSIHLVFLFVPFCSKSIF